MLLPPESKSSSSRKTGALQRRKNRILSDSASSDIDDAGDSTGAAQRPDGLEPPGSRRMEIEEWERKSNKILTEEDTDEVADLVTWCFVCRRFLPPVIADISQGQMGRSAIRPM